MGAVDQLAFGHVRGGYAQACVVVTWPTFLLAVPAIGSIAALRLANLIASMATAARRLHLACMWRDDVSRDALSGCRLI